VSGFNALLRIAAIFLMFYRLGINNQTDQGEEMEGLATRKQPYKI
jgi:hypothetical protein